MNKIYIIDKSTNITYYLIGVKEASPEQSATITEYPVPEGGKISDHSYKEPDVLTIQMISDGFDSVKKSYYIDIDGNITNLSYSAFKELIQGWLENATQLDIQTVHKLFTNMVINRISWREGQDSWSKFTPTITFKETRIARIYMTQINALNLSYSAAYSTEETTGETDGSEMSSESVLGGTLAGAAVGAGIGAAVGSIIPGLGTAVGAGIGAAVGGIIGFFTEIF